VLPSQRTGCRRGRPPQAGGDDGFDVSTGSCTRRNLKRPATAGEGGGQGRGRTADLPIFSPSRSMTTRARRCRLVRRLCLRLPLDGVPWWAVCERFVRGRGTLHEEHTCPSDELHTQTCLLSRRASRHRERGRAWTSGGVRRTTTISGSLMGAKSGCTSREACRLQPMRRHLLTLVNGLPTFGSAPSMLHWDCAVRSFLLGQNSRNSLPWGQQFYDGPLATRWGPTPMATSYCRNGWSLHANKMRKRNARPIGRPGGWLMRPSAAGR
jgi:hypothetical protein